MLFQSWSLMLGWALAAATIPSSTDPLPDATQVVVLGKESGRADFPAESIYEEGHLLDGERNGLWKRFHSNGNLRSAIHYVSGVPFGDYRLFDAQGQVYEEGRWEHGMNVGELLRYWPDGTLQQQLHFDAQGIAQGEQRHYHDNGQLEMVVPLEDGEEHGDLIQLDREGRVIQRTTFRNGQVARRHS